jgi:hypothetical protein
MLHLNRYAVILRGWINSGGGDEKRRREYIAKEVNSILESTVSDPDM